MSKRIELDIVGMTCGNCVRHVTEALEAQPGIKSVKVELESGKATIEAEASVVPEHLLETVEDTGYMARMAEA